MSCHRWLFLLLLVALVPFSATASGQSADVRKALSFSPVQTGIDYDEPNSEKAAKCKLISAKKIRKSGFVLIDDSGQVLRMFLNNGGDPDVDQWSYFRNGIEVYRDIDTDFDGKADEFRWFGNAGTRWGRDTDGDNRIDEWVAISAEEVSFEIIESLKARNEKRFRALMLKDKELNQLGLSKSHAAKVSKRLEETRNGFSRFAMAQKQIQAETEWVHFGGVQPSTIPAGTHQSTKDVVVYENVAAVYQTGEEHGQMSLGTLVRSGNAWRLVDLPVVLEDENTVAQSSLFLLPDDRFMEGTATASRSAGSEEMQALFENLESVEKDFAKARTGNDSRGLAKLNQKRADLLKEIIGQQESSKDKSGWIRQDADTVAGAYQNGEFADGLKEIGGYYSDLKKASAVEKNDLAYLLYRMVSARYSKMFEDSKPEDVSKVQEKYLEDLEKFVDVYPDVEQAADAMLQLALWAEYSSTDNSEKAEKWYKGIVDGFPESKNAEKAKGALTRLQSVGKEIEFSGPMIGGEKTYRISQDNGKVVLIHYWAGDSELDYSELARLYKKFERKGFNIVSVNLDSDSSAAKSAIQKSKLPGVHLFEEGGTDSPLSTKLGIALVPTMILVDKNGKVTNRNIRLSELEKSIDKLLK